MSESKSAAEGWYQDPYGSHEARWFSQGTPTALVRDAGIESHEAPPADAGRNGAVPAELPEETAGATDLLRADDAEGGEQGARADDRSPAEAALESFPWSAD
jgi:hypothetical protein